MNRLSLLALALLALFSSVGEAQDPFNVGPTRYGAFSVLGTEDTTQLTVKGNSTQTTPLLSVNDRDGNSYVSVSSNGSLTTTTPFRALDGTLAVPAYSFVNETGLGMSRNGANRLAFSAAGAVQAEIRNTGATTTDALYIFNLPIFAEAGGAISPNFTGGYSFDGDEDTGMYRPAANTLNFAAAATAIAQVNTGGVRMLASGGQFAGVNGASAATPDFSFVGDGTTGMFSSAASTIAFTTAGTQRASISSSALSLGNLVQVKADTGTAALPSYSFSGAGSEDNGFYRSAANEISIATNGTRAITVDATQNVSIPFSNLAVSSVVAGQGELTAKKIGSNNTTPTSFFHVTRAQFTSAQGIGLHINETTTTPAAGDIAMRVDFSGNNTATGVTVLEILDGNGSPGSITISGANAVSYNTTSDARLKKNVLPIEDGIARIKNTKPRYYNWIEDSSPGEGFLAQELQPIVPIAVSGSPDGDVNTAPMSVDYSKVVPVLTAAVKELIAKVETLEAKVAALEAAQP